MPITAIKTLRLLGSLANEHQEKKLAEKINIFVCFNWNFVKKKLMSRCKLAGKILMKIIQKPKTKSEIAKLTVVQHRNLIDACYKLNLGQMRLIFFACSKIDSKKSQPSEGIFVSHHEFADAYGLQNTNLTAKKIRAIVEDLVDSSISIYDPKTRITKKTNWLMHGAFHEEDDGDGVWVKFNPDVSPLLFELKSGNFTSVKFNELSRLDSFFAMRLNFWLANAGDDKINRINESCFEVTFNLAWLKDKTNLDTYSRWRDFEKRVLDPAVKKINQAGHLQVETSIVIERQKVTGITFKCTSMAQSMAKPQRPRLKKRPAGKKDSHIIGEWMKENYTILSNYESALKSYDSLLKLSLPDLKKLADYATIAHPDRVPSLKRQIEERKIKKQNNDQETNLEKLKESIPNWELQASKKASSIAESDSDEHIAEATAFMNIDNIQKTEVRIEEDGTKYIDIYKNTNFKATNTSEKVGELEVQKPFEDWNVEC